MTDRKLIEARIAELRGELARAEGTPTEVYSRIVGYYRSVRNWNAGKREEYGQRLVYGMPAGKPKRADGDSTKAAAAKVAKEAASPGAKASAAPRAGVGVEPPDAVALRDGVLVFTRETCPNCSPVANYVIASGMKATFVDVDRDEGFALAQAHNVMATPTVLMLDPEGREAFRAFDVASLQNRLAQGSRSRVEAR
jgi:ribonucleoside-triphosphate reductase